MDLTIVPLSDLCYTKFQQGDVEGTPRGSLAGFPTRLFAPWRAGLFSRDHQALGFARPIDGAARGAGAAPIVPGAALTPPPAPCSPIVPSLGRPRAAERLSALSHNVWESLTMCGRGRVPRRRRREMERICLRMGRLGTSPRDPRSGGERETNSQSINIQVPSPSPPPGVFPWGFVCGWQSP